MSAEKPSHGPSDADAITGSGDGGDSHPSSSLLPPLRLNIVILFMGSRGDLQPSLAIAKLLQRRHGHRVRIASHPPYRQTVEAAGVGFYSIGECDIKRMMERRLLPREELKKEIPVIKEEFEEMGERWWQACVGGTDGLEDGEKEEGRGFVADAVVSTIQVFNQTSAAARLGVPLHLYGMNPRVYSKEIPHSQAGWALKKPSKGKNRFSWWIQDFIFLHTLKDAINDLRMNGMGLEAFSPAWWLSQYNRMRVPCTCLWSPHLLPKPADWADNVTIGGFVFDESSRAEDYVPPPELVAFLEKGEMPVYIGFGSMSFPDAGVVFERILEAVRMAGVRAVVCRGWANFESGEVGEKGEGGKKGMENVLVMDETPHGWLFPRVRAVVCHGGSGTTAMALRSGRPVLVVPVAGDQPFWGARVAAVGCGPEAGFGIAEVETERFREKLEELLRPEYAERARGLAAVIADERPGEEACVEDLLRGCEGVYGAPGGRCEVFPERPAVWENGEGRRLSAVAAHVLVEEGRVRWDELREAEVVKWPDLVSPGDPVTGVVFGVQRAFGNIGADVKGKAFGFLILHILRAPLTILAAAAFGLFNLVDFILYELASPFEPKLFASNPRLYNYPQMLGFLLRAPAVELAGVATQPAILAKKGRGGGRVVLEVPLALLRALVALFNILIGFVGISLRQAELGCARAMGERPKHDVVAEARKRQGRIETERLVAERAEEGRGFREEMVRRWDNRGDA